MLGLLGIRKYIYLAIIGSILTAGLVGWKYVSDLQTSVVTLAANNAKLEESLNLSEQAVKDLQRNHNRVITEFERVQGEFKESRQRVVDLEKKLSEHDLGFLAQEKPGLIETIINNATKDVWEEFENLSDG